MIVGRFAGDWAMTKFGADRIVKFGGFVGGGFVGGSVWGLSIALAVPLSHSHPLIALVLIDCGFICAGLGIAPMVPAFISATGRIAGIAPSVAIARVGIIGIVSYFIGPVVTGNLADLINLPIAMGFPVLILTAAGTLAFATRNEKS